METTPARRLRSARRGRSAWIWGAPALGTALLNWAQTHLQTIDITAAGRPNFWPEPAVQLAIIGYRHIASMHLRCGHLRQSSIRRTAAPDRPRHDVGPGASGLSGLIRFAGVGVPPGAT